MKKTLLPIIAIAITSCTTNNTQQNDSTGNTLATLDTTAAQLTIEKPHYLSADLAMLSLKGQVKKTITESYPANSEYIKVADDGPSASEMTFDKEGNITFGLMGDFDWKNYERNAEKQIIKSSLKDNIINVSYRYTYSEDGNMLSSEFFSDEKSQNTTTYEYDEKCELTKQIHTSNGIRTEYTYQPTKYDNEGNWTERNLSYCVINRNNKDTYYSIERRTIKYYTDDEEETDDSIIAETNEAEEDTTDTIIEDEEIDTIQ